MVPRVSNARVPLHPSVETAGLRCYDPISYEVSETRVESKDAIFCSQRHVPTGKSLLRGETFANGHLFVDLLAGRVHSPFNYEEESLNGTAAPTLLDWTFAIEVPNPERASSKLGVTRKDAESIVMQCFKAKINVNGVYSDGYSVCNAEEERKVAFFAVYDKLPRSSDGIGKAWGESPPLSLNHSKAPGDENAPKSFLSLVRNMIIAKLALDCSIHTKCVLSDDAEQIYIIATCTTHELLREADLQSFPAPLDIVAVDPDALEPCTKTFYPLLYFYGAQSNILPGLKDKVERILTNLESQFRCDEPKGKYFENVLSFWSGIQTCSVKSAPNAPASSLGRQSSRRHLGRPRKQDETFVAFEDYLNLLCTQPLSFDGNAIKVINEKQVASNKTKLYNFYDRLKLPIVPPYLNFEIGLYKGKPWVWQHHYAKLLDSDRYIAVPFSGQQTIKLFKGLMDRQLDLEQLLDIKVVTSIFPLDKRDKLDRFQGTAAGMSVCSTEALAGGRSELFLGWGFPNGSPLQQIRCLVHSLFKPPSADAIRSYYGEDIAFYFGMSSHLSKWCFFPAVLGILTFILQLALSEVPVARAVVDIVYCFLIGCWATAWIESWKRQEATLISMWGQESSGNVNEVTRPSFRGLSRRSPINFRMNNDLCQPGIFSHGVIGWIPRRLFTSLVICVFTGADLGVMTGLLAARMELKKVMDPLAAGIITSCILSAWMLVISFANHPICKALNQLENHQFSKGYNSQLILKQSVVEMVNNFILYFYIAFGKGSFEGCLYEQGSECSTDPQQGLPMNCRVCSEELKSSYMSIFVTLAAMNFVELGILDIVIPPCKAFLTRKRKEGNPRSQHSTDSDGKATIRHILSLAAEKASFDLSLDVSGTYQEYMEIVVLFGHIVLFSVVFPLAPLVCMILLLIEVRIDGHKLFCNSRRPVPRAASGIGAWIWVFQAISWASVLTNAVLLTYNVDSFLSHLLGDQRVNVTRALTLVFISVALVSCKGIVMCVIPNVPGNLQLMQKHNVWVQQTVMLEDDCLLSLPVDHLDPRVHGMRECVPTHNLRDYGLTPVRALRDANGVERDAVFGEKEISSPVGIIKLVVLDDVTITGLSP